MCQEEEVYGWEEWEKSCCCIYIPLLLSVVVSITQVFFMVVGVAFRVGIWAV